MRGSLAALGALQYRGAGAGHQGWLDWWRRARVLQTPVCRRNLSLDLYTLVEILRNAAACPYADQPGPRGLRSPPGDTTDRALALVMSMSYASACLPCVCVLLAAAPRRSAKAYPRPSAGELFHGAMAAMK